MAGNQKKNTPPAVVVGLQHLTALGTVRSLSQMHVPVIGIISQPKSPLAKTNKCKKIFCSDVNAEPLIETLLKLGKTLDEKAVLFPSADSQVSLISENREILAQYFRFGLPEKKVVKQLLHKTEFSIFAEKNGFKIPKTLVITGSTDIKACSKSVDFPCILKPVSRTPKWQQQNPGNKVYRIESEAALLKAVPEALESVDSLILQEWIEGRDSDVYFCLMYFDNHSEPKATFVGRKIRQWLPEIGSTACAEKKFNKTVLNESLRLFKFVQYEGLGSVEFKFDRKSRQFIITEPTVGRPNLQSYVAVANGINIPYIAYRDLTGKQICQLDQPSENGSVKWINEFREYNSVRFYMKRGELSANDWYKSIRGPKTYALFSLRDPLPFLSTVNGKKRRDKIRFLKFFFDLQKKKAKT